MAQRVKTDWVLLAAIAVLVVFGLMMLFSASSMMSQEKYKSSWYVVKWQFVYALVAAAALLFFKSRDYRTFRKPSWAFVSVGLTLLLLAAVYFLDPRTHRWLRLGPISLQPSELAKPALILFLAYCLTMRSRSVNDWHTLAQATLALGLLAGAVVVADLGTAFVLVATAVAVFYAAGLQKRFFAAALLIGLLCAAGAVAVKPYRIVRLFGFFDPEYRILETRIVNTLDPEGKLRSYVDRAAHSKDPDYHVRQSKIAVGSGGVLGRGFMDGRQKYYYLPEAHTDFIYAVVGEELGLAGSLLVLAGFLVILWRGLRLCWLATDDFARHLALGVTTAVVVQALVNMSVVLDLAPTKGIPLPMISQGGSSLLSTLASLGLLLSVSEHAG
ncbi:MAG: cell division protein FtsW [Acidobacteria bacterium]|nr:cell division protein FtsW [Acidobacteriota bacterium]